MIKTNNKTVAYMRLSLIIIVICVSGFFGVKYAFGLINEKTNKDKGLKNTSSSDIVAVTNTPIPTINIAPTTTPTISPENKENLQTKKVPILYYHAISDKTFGIAELFVRPAMFEKHLEYLKENGYTPIWFEDLDSIDKIEKPIIITFDDGYKDNYEAAQVLRKYGFKAVVFMISGSIGKSDYLTEDQILKMKDVISFQNHTVNHKELIYLDNDSIEKELTDATNSLESLTGQKIIAFAYPIGLYNSKVKEIVKKHFKYAVIIDRGVYTINSDKHLIPRLYMKRSDTMDNFVAKLKY